jgi:hypothetical protein
MQVARPYQGGSGPQAIEVAYVTTFSVAKIIE